MKAKPNLTTLNIGIQNVNIILKDGDEFYTKINHNLIIELFN